MCGNGIGRDRNCYQRKLDDEKVDHGKCGALHMGLNQRLEDLKDAVQTTARDSKDDRIRLEGKIDRLIRINGGDRHG
jgi:hypothetical protein